MKARIALFLLLTLALASTAPAATTPLVVQDSFTGASAALSWTALNGACLTAGDGSGSIPACAGLTYYGNDVQYGLTSNRDAVGQGALRFTAGYPYYAQNGAIISNFTFPSNQGLNVTFTTYTYGGDSGGGGQDGADGIGFYLLDGGTNANLGAWGGSLGYSCSNTNPPYNGMVGAYLGLGIDEYGNFLNNGDNTATGAPSNGTNGGYNNYQPGRIGLRGYGNVSWSWLNANHPNKYPSSLTSSQQKAAVQNTCKYGHLWDYSNPSSPSKTSTTVADYAVIPNAWQILPSNQPIALEPNPKNATPQITRTQATPITYQLKITQDGLLSLSYSYNEGTYRPVITNQSIAASNGSMPSSFKFGFGASDGGSDNVHEITCFKATPANLSSSSAGLNVQQTGQVRTGTQVYLAYYHPNNWWGQLTSQYLQIDPTTGAVSIDPSANWDASCVLTGGNCATTGVTGMPAEAPGSRNLLTWNGSAGVALAWANLSAAEQAALGSTTNAQSRLAYLTGVRSDEITSSGSGLYRARTSVLGDIIDSSPVWVGAPSAPYPATWTDALYPSATNAEDATGAQTYPAFQTTEATRENIVYDGANDGFMHGFRSGNFSSAGVYDPTTNDGEEVIAFMPQSVLTDIHSSNPLLDFSSPQYAHNFYVDATPGTGDLFYNNAWHTWLVSGLGAGGSALFALNITRPSQFGASTAAQTVVGEWDASTLPCVVSGCGQNLGQTYGTPVIRRLHNGDWAIIFGNGLNSANGVAGIYILTINGSTGTPDKAYFLSTGTGTSSNPDGITYVTPVDLDGDHITDYVYAGDVQGNVWRFNLTSQSPSSWAVSKYGSGGPKPLFTAQYCSGGVCTRQPITTQLQVIATNPGTVLPRVIINFGTGQQIPQTNSSDVQYAPGKQTLYGIWDWDFGTWDGMSGQGYQSLSSLTTPISRSTLQQQTVTGAVSTGGTTVTGYRTVSDTGICFVGQTCAGQAGKDYGWYMDLPGVNGTGATEQVIYNPIEAYGGFVVNTTVPANNSPFTCSVQTAQGWTMAINPLTGGALGGSFFGAVGAPAGTIVSGVALSGTGSPSVVSANQVPYLVTQTVNGTGAVVQVNPQGNSGGRLTWIEVR